MKTTYALLSTLLTVVLAVPMFGQGADDGKSNADMRHNEMARIIGKPTVDETVEGLHMKVWLMTQKQHKKMMRGRMGQMMMQGEKEGVMSRREMKDSSMEMGARMKRDDMGMSKAAMDSMMVGTHFIILEVKDASLGKEIDDASAKALLVSPSNYTATVDLRRMMGHFGGPLTFNEKGTFTIAVSVNVAGVSKTKEFKYAVK